MAGPDPNDNLARLMELVSPRVGIIRTAGRVQRGADEPDPPVICHATLSHFDHRMVPPRERESAGKGRTEREAMAGAIGEALERYCAAHLNGDATRRSSFAAMNENAIAPPDCVLYSERQYERKGFPYHRWNPSDEITWTRACELPDRRQVLVPASLVYMAQSGPRREDALVQATSNGLAAGPDFERAALSALTELAERDAFLITWMTRLPAPEVDFASARGPAMTIRTHYARHGIKLRVFRLCTDLPIHPMMTMATDTTGTGPAAVVALGCHLNPAKALEKSLFEICQVLPGEKQNFREKPPAPRLREYADVKTLEDHSAFLMVAERMGEFSFLLDNERKVRLEELPDHSRGETCADLDFLVAALREAGCRVLCADLTTPDLTTYPVRVVRAIATGLQPIHFGHGEERLGGRRLFELPRKLGFTSRALAESDLNPCPHPLA